MGNVANTEIVAETTKTNTESQGLINIVDRNTIVWWGLLLASAMLGMFFTPWGYLFWLLALLVEDVLLYGFGTSFLFDSQMRMRRNYQWMHNLYDNTAGSGRDLGFNLVVDGALSQRAKYEHMAEQLGLEPGMVICDIGCGYGDWLKYCRDELGCEAVGINITPEQANYAHREYGLEVHITNWKDVLKDGNLQGQLYGRFDAVTFMDTVEHYVSMEDRHNAKNKAKIYSDMCHLASELINKESKAKRVFMSCLHQTHKPRNWKFYFNSYFMDKFYSGYYPFVDEGPLKACEPWFEVMIVEDKTEDYRLTGVKDRKHFQAVKVKLTPKKLAYIGSAFLLDPFVIHRLAYYGQDSWMFFYGDDAYSEKYDSVFREQASFVLLYWATLQLSPISYQAPDSPT